MLEHKLEIVTLIVAPNQGPDHNTKVTVSVLNTLGLFLLVIMLLINPPFMPIIFSENQPYIITK